MMMEMTMIMMIVFQNRVVISHAYTIYIDDDGGGGDDDDMIM